MKINSGVQSKKKKKFKLLYPSIADATIITVIQTNTFTITCLMLYKFSHFYPQ